MVLLNQLWDDVVAGPQPERGLDKLRGITTKSSNIQDGGTASMPESPVSPASPGSASASPRKDNVWRSVFNPGSSRNTRNNIGAAYYDNPTQPNSPTVYDWLYSDKSKNQYR